MFAYCSVLYTSMLFFVDKTFTKTCSLLVGLYTSMLFFVDVVGVWSGAVVEVVGVGCG
jgi:hypothetical protein